MSMEYMVKVNKHRFANPFQKLIMLQLADNADINGKCYPSYSYIADRSGCGKSTVRKHIKILETLGYLTIENRSNEKGHTSNLYAIQTSRLNDDPMPRGSTAPIAPDSTGVDHEVAQGMPPDSTPPMPPGSTRTSHSSKPVNEPLEGFDYFINIYPKEITQSEQEKARQRWMIEGLDQKAKEIIGGLKAQLEANDERFARENKYIKHPKNYLREKCWEDKIVSTTKGKKSKDQSIVKLANEISNYLRFKDYPYKDGLAEKPLFKSKVAYTIFSSIDLNVWGKAKKGTSDDFYNQVASIHESINGKPLLEIPQELRA